MKFYFYPPPNLLHKQLFYIFALRYSKEKSGAERCLKKRLYATHGKHDTILSFTKQTTANLDTETGYQANYHTDNV